MMLFAAAHAGWSDRPQTTMPAVRLGRRGGRGWGHARARISVGVHSCDVECGMEDSDSTRHTLPAMPTKPILALVRQLAYLPPHPHARAWWLAFQLEGKRPSAGRAHISIGCLPASLSLPLSMKIISFFIIQCFRHPGACWHTSSRPGISLQRKGRTALSSHGYYTLSFMPAAGQRQQAWAVGTTAWAVLRLSLLVTTF